MFGKFIYLTHFFSFFFFFFAANHSRQFITLSFRTMGTECSYDYVFVYDGDSFRSPLLGSFSGKTEPQQVTSSSGYVSTRRNGQQYIDRHIAVSSFCRGSLFAFIVSAYCVCERRKIVASSSNAKLHRLVLSVTMQYQSWR